MQWVEGHAHLPWDTDDVVSVLDGWGIDAVMNICVDHANLGGLEAQRGWYSTLKRRLPDRFAWATSFSLEGFGTPEWAEGAVRSVLEDYASGGAAGCKVWKNIGMELRDPATGDWVFVDDGRFAPVFEALERAGKPLLTHIAEPIAAWSPLDPRNPHYGYYSVAKQWHWHGRSDVPTHDRLIASRDALLERYPRLPLVGLHLGSQEHDLSAVAHRLERFPQYMIDLGARLGDMLVHADTDRAGLIAFFTRFRERIIWGVDWVLTRSVSSMTPDERARLRDAMARRYDLERRFYATDEPVSAYGRDVRGLRLPDDVLARITRDNARHLYWR